MNSSHNSNFVILYLSSDSHRDAVINALECQSEHPCVLVALFKGKDAAESFRSSVGTYLLYDAQNPYRLDEQINLPELVNIIVDQVKASDE